MFGYFTKVFTRNIMVKSRRLFDNHYRAAVDPRLLCNHTVHLASRLAIQKAGFTIENAYNDVLLKTDYLEEIENSSPRNINVLCDKKNII